MAERLKRIGTGTILLPNRPGIAQTAACIRNTGLSLKKYIIHKLVLTLLTAFYYLGWRLLSPDTFLL